MADNKKKGDYRVVVKVEILDDHLMYKKGQVIEVHPKLAALLVEQSVGKVTKKTT